MQISRVTIPQTTVVEQTNPAQLKQTVDDALEKGADLVQDADTKNYYMKVAAQPSAAEGESFVKVDGDLAVAILDALKTGGVISRPEALDLVMEKITDGGRYGDGEAILTRLLLAACDDRKMVKLNGDRVNLTGAAETAFNKAIHSFWGTLGANARWGSVQPKADAGPTMQSGGYDKT